jgi:hypothetical protein
MGGVVKRFLVLGVLAISGGCGSDKSPSDKCDDLLSTVCDRVVSCLPGLSTRTQCTQTLQQALPCGRTKQIGDSYDHCLDELSSNTCAMLFPLDEAGDPALVLPVDCRGVIINAGALPALTADAPRARSSLLGAMAGASRR